MNDAVLEDQAADQASAQASALKGVFAAVLTPQTADLAPAHGALADHTR
jgi:hypothetical protein